MILENNKLEIRSNFKIVEEEIDMNFFLRCHKSFIVNKERIIVQQGNYLTLIGHNEKIPIGEKYRDHVNTEISKMLRGRRG
jgi:DNA-binding LytR/AlgR family response regulator